MERGERFILNEKYNAIRMSLCIKWKFISDNNNKNLLMHFSPRKPQWGSGMGGPYPTHSTLLNNCRSYSREIGKKSLSYTVIKEYQKLSGQRFRIFFSNDVAVNSEYTRRLIWIDHRRDLVRSLFYTARPFVGDSSDIHLRSPCSGSH